MPLFFIIAIGLGAATVGATTVDVTSDIRQHNQEKSSAVLAPAPAFDASAYATTEDCLNAAALQGASLALCPKSS